MKELKVSNSDFLKIIKRNKLIYLKECNEDYQIKDKIKVINLENGKHKKYKITNLYYGKTKEEFNQTLKDKNKYLCNSDIDFSKGKEYVGLELKHSRKIIRKSILIIFLLLILFGLIYLIRFGINTWQNKKVISQIEKVKEEEIYYVFIEINPSIALEVKNDKIISTACLNDDCYTYFKNVEVKNKKLNEVIDILYTKAKDAGINVEKVSVSSVNNNVESIIQNKDYVEFHNINNDTQKEYLDNLEDNTDLGNDKKDYNEKLLDVYKKDSDYDKLYSCNIVNDEIECFITDEFFAQLSIALRPNNLFTVVDYQQQLMRLLDKFNIKYETSGIEGTDLLNVAVRGIYIDNQYHNFSQGACANCVCYRKAHINLYDEENTFNLKMTFIPINKIDLVHLKYNSKDVILLNEDSTGPDIIHDGCMETETYEYE